MTNFNNDEKIITKDLPTSTINPSKELSIAEKKFQIHTFGMANPQRLPQP